MFKFTCSLFFYWQRISLCIFEHKILRLEVRSLTILQLDTHYFLLFCRLLYLGLTLGLRTVSFFFCISGFALLRQHIKMEEKYALTNGSAELESLRKEDSSRHCDEFVLTSDCSHDRETRLWFCDVKFFKEPPTLDTFCSTERQNVLLCIHLCIFFHKRKAFVDTKNVVVLYFLFFFVF